jgi:UDP-glucose 4-epimerase
MRSLRAMSQGAVVLVTGGTGLIGSQVARELISQGLKPLLFNRNPNLDNVRDIADASIVVQGDVLDTESLSAALDAHEVEYIIHLAAFLGVHMASDPGTGIMVNCIGTDNVFRLARDHGVRRVVWASSAAVYGQKTFYSDREGGPDRALNEDDAPVPGNLYGGTKYLDEMLASQYRSQGSDIVGLRPVLTFGTGFQPGAVGVLQDAMRKASNGGRGVVGAPWARESGINPIHVEDCASLFVTTCLRPAPMKQAIYNTGTGEHASAGDMMRIVSQISGGSVEFEHESPGSSLFNGPNLDSSRLREELNWTPKFELATAVEDIMSKISPAGA